MQSGPNKHPGAHFHIRWQRPSGLDQRHLPSSLDWEVFSTPEEAETRATELARPGEAFVINQFDDACPKCASIKERKFAARRY